MSKILFGIYYSEQIKRIILCLNHLYYDIITIKRSILSQKYYHVNKIIITLA